MKRLRYFALAASFTVATLAPTANAFAGVTDNDNIERTQETNYHSNVALDAEYYDELTGETKTLKETYSSTISGDCDSEAVGAVLRDYHTKASQKRRDLVHDDILLTEDSPLTVTTTKTETSREVHDEITQSSTVLVGDVEDINTTANQGTIKINTVTDIYQVCTLHYRATLTKDFRTPLARLDLTLTVPTVGDKVELEPEDSSAEGGRSREPLQHPVWSLSNPSTPVTLGYSAWYESADLDTASYFVGTFQPDTDYYADLEVYANQGYRFTDDTVVTVNGQKIDNFRYATGIAANMSYGGLIAKVHTAAAEQSDSEAGDQEPVVPGPQTQTYHIVERPEQPVQPGSEVRVKADGDIEKFWLLKVDGQETLTKFYKLEKGSTIVTLLEEFVKTLAPGKHTMTFVYLDGEVSADFTIASTTEKPKAVKTSEVTKTVVANPQTSDDISIYILAFVFSLVGLVGVDILLRK